MSKTEFTLVHEYTDTEGRTDAEIASGEFDWPEAAKAPLTYLRSRDEQVPELRILDATGMVWGCFSPGVWLQMDPAYGPYQREWFHGDDWEEISD